MGTNILNLNSDQLDEILSKLIYKKECFISNWELYINYAKKKGTEKQKINQAEYILDLSRYYFSEF